MTVAALATVVSVSPAYGGRRYTTSNASTNRTGIEYSIAEVNSHARRATTAPSSGVQCDYELAPGNVGLFSGYQKRAPSKTSDLAHRSCTDGTDDFVWVDACDFMDLEMCPDPAPRVDPVILARRVRDRLAVPELMISSNPRRGLVGLKTWFWIEGGDRPVSDSLAAFGLRVEVEARPVSYRWEFGDGTVVTTRSPGRPYPQRSPVKHRYERSSASHLRGYAVSVDTVFDVRWRANGGRWQSLPQITRGSERFYRVAESQAVNSDG